MPPEQHSSPAMAAKRDYSKFYTPGAIVLAGVIIGIFAMVGLSHSGSGSAANTGGAGTAPTQAVNIKDVKTAGDPYIGNANAPVTLAFWSDYQCPFCKAVEVGGVQGITTPAAIPDVIKQYVDTGKLKIVFKDFQFLGQDSIDDGEYARAIWALYPDKYYAWRTAMYAQQPQENSLSEAANKTHVEQVTQSIAGIDLQKVEANIAANKAAYDAAMQADMQEGENFGITGTPGFITGTTEIDGAQPLSAFTAAIDAQLK